MSSSRTIRQALVVVILVTAINPSFALKQEEFSVVEASIPEMQKAMTQKRVTSRQLVTQYLTRIAVYDNKLRAAISINPNALAEADALDAERAHGKVRGPLHGIPIALKDIIQTTNMPTTGGALAFNGFLPPYEATLTKNLREAGAIIIAKTSLTELANWVAGSNLMPPNYNSISGFGMNPYDPRQDPRESSDGRPWVTPGGSSSGIGTAANLWAANVGTETSGSILNPANATMLAAIKPTVGRISRYGVIPITADQDTPGPMAKTVSDVAILLGAMEGSMPEPNDPGTTACAPPRDRDYTPYLKADGLKGARIGIPRVSFYERLNAEQLKVMEEAITILRRKGAIVVDPANIPSVMTPDPQMNFDRWNICSGPAGAKGTDMNCSSVLKYGMKLYFNRWLATLGPDSPVKTLTELREWNKKHQAANAMRYGQANLDISDEIDLDTDRAKYEADRARDLDLAATHGIDEAMKSYRLDALLFPGVTGAGIAARPGYPTVIVPFGMTRPSPPPLGFPAAFDGKPQPFGVSFTGMACSEPRLIELGYSFEQATKRRVPPPSAP